MFNSLIDKIKIWLGYRCPFWKECPYFVSYCHNNWDWCGQYKCKEKKVNWIVGLSFGKGMANLYLANVVILLQKEYPKAQVILQEEIEKWHSFLRDFYLKYEKKYLGKPKYIIPTYENFRKRTEDILREMKKIIIAEKKDWKRIVIVAHPHHLGRCMIIAKNLGFEPTKWNLIVSQQIPYDPYDSQWWVRNPLIFFFWNLAGLICWKLKRLKPKKHYRMKAETGFLLFSQQKETKNGDS